MWRALGLALAIGLSVAADARAQNVAFGMNTRVLTPRMADKMVELGAGVVRVPFGWDLIEPDCKGCFNWTTTDAWRDEARRTRRVLFASLAYAPSWANGGHPYNYTPINYQDWYDFVYAAASRYRDDVWLWGVWNEPNLNQFMHGADLKVYRALVIGARAAILAANPRASVLGPDVSHHAMASGWYAAAMTDIGDLFDIVTVHWYLDGPSLEHMMDDLVRPYARGRPIWLSETGMKPCGSSFGEVGQALLVSRVLNAFLPRRAWWTGVSFYDLHDDPLPGRDCGSGVTRFDWSNRPAFTVYQGFIRVHP
jgi:hypothetical protein